MKYSNWLSKNIYLPISDIVTGQSIYKKLHFLEKSQWWSRKEIDEYQNEKLRKLIKHSVTSVPYYKDLFEKNNLSIEDIKTKEDLYKIPILTKEEIKKQGIDRFISTNYPKNKIVSESSSGSTGEPLFYKTTKEAYSLNIAANLRGWQWTGFKLGDRYIKLSQNSRNNPLKKLQDKISNNLYLATNPLIDSNFEFLLKEIENYKPRIIRCYPDPLLFLARYKKQHPEYKYQPKAITTTGNTLYVETRKEIEDAFGCKIFDSYNCESNSNVFECETHNGYHSAEEYGISEILDENNKPIHSGIGRLISTDLYNYAHPFIRYETQDQVELLKERCSCGRELLSLKRILGRASDVLETTNGKYIVHDFTIFFSLQNSPLKKSVESFQVIGCENKVVLNLVVNNRFNSVISDYIKNYWMVKFNEIVDVNVVKDIPLTKSGKRKFIINEK